MVYAPVPFTDQPRTISGQTATKTTFQLGIILGKKKPSIILFHLDSTPAIDQENMKTNRIKLKQELDQ